MCVYIYIHNYTVIQKERKTLQSLIYQTICEQRITSELKKIDHGKCSSETVHEYANIFLNLYLPGHAHSCHNEPTQRAGYSYRLRNTLEHVEWKVSLHLADSQAKQQDGYQNPPESITPRDF